MPSWKKVITSGSNAALNSLTVSNGITGSLFGTASFATTASYSLDGVNSIPHLEYNNTDKTIWNNGKGNLSLNLSYGESASVSITTGTGNLAIGRNSLYSNTTGTVNIAIGNDSLYYNNGGTNNVAVGQQSLGNMTYGFNNVTLGHSTLGSLDTGNFNTVLGHFAGFFLDGNSSNNILIGNEAGPASTTVESNKLYIASGSGTPLIGGDFSTKTVTISGSLNVLGIITGSLFGTSSWAVSASWAPVATTAATASFVTASNVYGPFGSNSILSSSFAVSSSRTVSSSFASTASFVNPLNQNVVITGSLTVSGSTGTVFNSNVDTLILTGSLLVTGSTVLTGPLTVGISNITTNTITPSAAGANTVFNQATGSFTGAKYLYTVTSASNARTGEVMAVWNGTTTQYTDNSTLDIGSTTAVTASVSIVTSQAQFNMQTTNAGWTIKSQVTYL